VTTCVLPGLLDVHVHLRHPGGAHKETIATGTAAALAGGYTAILAMPNTRPPIVDREGLATVRRDLAESAYCDVGQFIGGTDHNAAEAFAAAGIACGLKLYVNDTFGPLRIESLGGMQSHFLAWKASRPLVVHAEELSVAAAIGLAAAHRRPVHVAHVSLAEEIRLIGAAKEAGLPVTCEVSPHHLLLTEDDARALGPLGDVRPRLARAADRDALWEHLDVIDCIATDHAPHTLEEKAGLEPPPGVPGLETALPLLLTEVYGGRLTLDRLVELLSTTPARLFGVPTPSESSVEVEIGAPWALPDRGYQTRVDWSPFSGCTVRGAVLRTSLRGAVAWADGRVRAAPGSGRLIPSAPQLDPPPM
jgi:carbamoyl-phosphate synthase/aspartate carbamoyltransferase/dihydroorotase